MIYKESDKSSLHELTKESWRNVYIGRDYDGGDVYSRWSWRWRRWQLSTWVQGGPGKSTDKVPNDSPTTASTSSDLHGQAVLNAGEQIKSRMKPVAEKGTLSSFAKLASACYSWILCYSCYWIWLEHWQRNTLQLVYLEFGGNQQQDWCGKRKHYFVFKNVGNWW